SIYQNLVIAALPDVEQPTSIHLCDFPEVDPNLIDKDLEQSVQAVREIVSMGRSLRERYKLKTRQPLQSVTVVHHDDRVLASAKAYASLIEEELNVKSVLLQSNATALADISFKANFKRLGPKVGRDMKAVAQAISTLSFDDWTEIANGQPATLGGHMVEVDDILVNQTPKEDVVIETKDALSVALDHRLNESLIQEGLAREVVSKLQRMRKEIGLDITDRISLSVVCDNVELRQALVTFEDYIKDEVLADQFEFDSTHSDSALIEIDGKTLQVLMRKLSVEG
ncbi:MAG: DUF5915 domain-containing protein, partial [Bradymonadia bacterium]